MDKSVDTCLVPCGYACCLVCYFGHIDSNGKICPFCKGVINSTNKLFI